MRNLSYLIKSILVPKLTAKHSLTESLQKIYS